MNAIIVSSLAGVVTMLAMAVVNLVRRVRALEDQKLARDSFERRYFAKHPEDERDYTEMLRRLRERGSL